MNNRLCSRCNIVKPIIEFYKRKNRPGGHEYYCKECSWLRCKKYRVGNNRYIEYQQNYQREYQKEYSKLPKVKEYRKQYVNSGGKGNLAKNLRKRLKYALLTKPKRGSAIRDLGCTIEELKVHLEAKFTQGMSWTNYGSGRDKWNIDHVIPLSKFDLTIREEIIKAYHYTNLQPMWSIDNSKKYNKILS